MQQVAIDMLPPTFEQEKARAADRLSGLAPATRIALAALFAIGGALAVVIDGTALRIVALAVLAGASLWIWQRSQHRQRRLREKVEATAGVELWFHTPDSGLVFFDERGVFVERARRLFTYAATLFKVRNHVEGTVTTFATRIVSVSYEESHAMKLQWMTQPEGASANVTYDTRVVRLPPEISPSDALRVAVDANRKAAAA